MGSLPALTLCPSRLDKSSISLRLAGFGITLKGLACALAGATMAYVVAEGTFLVKVFLDHLVILRGPHVGDYISETDN